jgi:hypothetical protein
MSPSFPGRWLALTAATAVLLFALASVRPTPRTAQALSNCDAADMSIDGEQQAFLRLINNYRATVALQPGQVRPGHVFGVWAKNQGSSPPAGYEVSAANQFTVIP